MELNYIGKYQPKGMKIDVDRKTADELIKMGQWSSETNPEELVEDSELVVIPTKKWTEKGIKAWIEERDIPVDYDIKRDTKKEILKRLADGGHI